MTQEQIIDEITKLPRKERWKIASRIIGLVRNGNQSLGENKFRRELSRDERLTIARSLSGTFKPEGKYMPLTKEEDREIIANYLEEKYR